MDVPSDGFLLSVRLFSAPRVAATVSSYVQSIRDALAARARIEAPRTWTLAVPVLVLLAVIVTVAIVVAPEGDIDYHFRSEKGIITACSAISLSMASGFAGACFLIEGRPGYGLRLWWLLTFLGFLFFACDELLRFHENIGTVVRHQVGDPTSTFRNWNDVVVILYGVVAVVVLGFLGPRVLRIPLHAELLACGFVCYVLHTTIDVLPHRGGAIGDFMGSFASSIPEEGFKLGAAMFFAVAMLSALRILVRAPNAVAPTSDTGQARGAV
jgi:hypothetical protein